MPWPENKKNVEYHVKDPTGERYVYIWGGEPYKNVSSPKLPSGAYNSYDTQFLPHNNSPRGAGRFVREQKSHKLYYTADHYKHWCYVGTQYG